MNVNTNEKSVPRFFRSTCRITTSITKRCFASTQFSRFSTCWHARPQPPCALRRCRAGMHHAPPTEVGILAARGRYCNQVYRGTAYRGKDSPVYRGTDSPQPERPTGRGLPAQPPPGFHLRVAGSEPGGDWQTCSLTNNMKPGSRTQ